MSASTTTLETLGDAELISAVRGGDVEAYGALFERHVEAARRLARQLVAAGDVEDLVSEAFIKVLHVLQRGGGPDVAFRAYLLTAVRRLRVDRLRATSRLHTTDDMDAFDPGVPFRDTAVEGFENAAAARAFASLPERWQMVLWHTEVEGARPADIAPLLGMSANSVSALAYRAREGLRQAFLNEHAGALEERECRWTHEHLGAYIRNGTSRRDGAKVEQHLTECRPCTAVYLELSDVNSNLAAVLGPLLLGGLAAAYVGQAASGGVAASTGLSVLVGRVRDLVAANATASSVAGVSVAGVAATVAVVAGAITVGSDGPARTPLADPPAVVARTQAAAPPSVVPSTPVTTPRTARNRPVRTVDVRPPDATEAPAEDAPAEVPTEVPAEVPSEVRSEDPSEVPSEVPAEVPSVDPTPTPTPEIPAPVPTPSPTPGPETPSPEPPSPSPEPPSPSPEPPSPSPEPPSPPPTPTPTPTPTVVDTTIAEIEVTENARRFTLTIAVRDVPAVATDVTLTITSTGVETIEALDDDRCEGDAPGTPTGTLTCDLTHDASPVVLSATSASGGTVTAHVGTTPGDADATNNTAHAQLPGPADRVNAVEP